MMRRLFGRGSSTRPARLAATFGGCSTTRSQSEAAATSSTLSEEDMEALGLVFHPNDGNVVFASRLQQQKSGQGNAAAQGTGGLRRPKLVSVVRPDLEKEFDRELNPAQNWRDLTMDSRYVAMWKCSVCGNKYKHEVADRVRNTFDAVTPCPSCRSRNMAQARHLSERKVVRDFQNILSAYAAKSASKPEGALLPEDLQREMAEKGDTNNSSSGEAATLEGEGGEQDQEQVETKEIKTRLKSSQRKKAAGVAADTNTSNKKTVKLRNVRKVRELPEWRKLELQMTCWELLELTQGLVQAARGLLIQEYKEINAKLAAQRVHLQSLQDAHEATLSAHKKKNSGTISSSTLEDSLNDPSVSGNGSSGSNDLNLRRDRLLGDDAIHAADPIQQMSNKELARVMVVGYEIRRLNDLEALLSRSNAGKNFALSTNPDNKDLLSAWNETTQPITPEFLFTPHEQKCIHQEFTYQRGLYDLAIQAGFAGGMVSPGALSGHRYVDRTDPFSGAFRDTDPEDYRGNKGASRGKMSPFARFPAVSPGRVAPILNKVQIVRLTHLLRLWVDQAFLKAQVESEEASGGGNSAEDDKPLRLRCRVVLLHLATYGQGERSILEQILTSKNASVPTAVESKEELLVNIATCCIDNADSETILQQGRDAYFWRAHPGGYQGQVRKQARDAAQAERSGGRSAKPANPEIQYEPNQGYFYYFDPDYQQYYYSYNGADYTDQQGNPAPYRDWGDEGQNRKKKSYVAPRHIVEERLAQYQQQAGGDQQQQQHQGGGYDNSAGGQQGYYDQQQQQQQQQYPSGGYQQQQPYYQQ